MIYNTIYIQHFNNHIFVDKSDITKTYQLLTIFCAYLMIKKIHHYLTYQNS